MAVSSKIGRSVAPPACLLHCPANGHPGASVLPQFSDIMLALFVLVPVHRTLCAVSAAISKPWLRALEVCTMQVTNTDLGPATLGMVWRGEGRHAVLGR